MIASAFIWYLAVATPQGGIAVMPIPFDTREDCQAAIAEYARAEAGSDGWTLKCIPSTGGFGSGDDEFAPPAGTQE